jgi:hypothetical protein
MCLVMWSSFGPSLIDVQNKAEDGEMINLKVQKHHGLRDDQCEHLSVSVH